MTRLKTKILVDDGDAQETLRVKEFLGLSMDRPPLAHQTVASDGTHYSHECRRYRTDA